MPRISAEARATATAQQSGKLAPSPHLSTAEKKAWRNIVGATAAGHLSERDRPLLDSYVSLFIAQQKLQQHVAESTAEQLIDSEGAGKALTKLESIGKTLAAVANRLKISPLAGHSAPHKAGQRDETPAAGPLLGGGIRRVA